MMLKRWALNCVAVLVGIVLGAMVVEYARDKMEIPPLAAAFLTLFFAALFYSIAHVAGPKLFPGPSVADLFRPDLPRRPWAWLKPAGVVPRSPFPLNKDQIFIGREVRCDVMLNNDSVSRRHAEVVRMAEGWLIRDLGSRNGTYVNGQRVEEYVLQEGDLITIGDINLNFEGPRQPVRGQGPEPVSHLVLHPEDGLDTAVHRGDDDTELWRPRKDV